MDKRPYSAEAIEQLKATGYVPPKPLHLIFVILLTFVFPLGIIYIINKAILKRLNAGYMLSQCKTDKQREKLFSRLRKRNLFVAHQRKNPCFVINPAKPGYYSGINIYNRHK